MKKKPRVNYSNEEKIDSKPIKTSLEAVTVLLRCIRVGCADLSQRHSDSPLSCHFSPAPSPSDPTETLHGRPSREGGGKQKSERTCPSDASPLSSFKCNDIAIQDATSIFETMLLLLLLVPLNFDSVKHRRNTDAQVQVLGCQHDELRLCQT